MHRWQAIAVMIQGAIGRSFEVKSARSVSGGCINQGYCLSDGITQFFVKLNQADRLEMFVAEALGLATLAEAGAMRVSRSVCHGVTGEQCFLVLEWLEFGRSGDWALMGQQLASLHAYSGSQEFGWSRDNTIGSTPQVNSWMPDWTEFWQTHRIGYQFELAGRNVFPKADRLLAKIPQILAGHQPTPSIVHGDLWGGNAGFLADGTPVIFDPAIYWGDREVDLAMTELFGGFPPAFYAGYESILPIVPGYAKRKLLYNLYQILNHYNLFGGSYQNQANSMIDRLL
jgi:fructosamine-3-kinase